MSTQQCSRGCEDVVGSNDFPSSTQPLSCDRRYKGVSSRFVPRSEATDHQFLTVPILKISNRPPTGRIRLSLWACRLGKHGYRSGQIDIRNLKRNRNSKSRFLRLSKLVVFSVDPIRFARTGVDEDPILEVELVPDIEFDRPGEIVVVG